MEVFYPYVNIYNFRFNQRLINFDNKYTAGIYQFNESMYNPKLTELFNLSIQDNDYHGIGCFYSCIKRDVLASKTDCLNEINIYLQIAIKSVDRYNQEVIDNFCSQIIDSINQTAIDLLHKNDDLERLFRPIIIDFQSEMKKNSNLSVTKLVKQLLLSNRGVLFQKLGEYNNEWINPVHNLELYDSDLSFNYVFWCEKIKAPLHLFSLNFNLRNDNQELIETKKIKQKEGKEINNISNNQKDYICINLNFSKLMLYLLGFKHIAQVTQSPWTNDEIEKFKKEGIDFL